MNDLTTELASKNERIDILALLVNPPDGLNRERLISLRYSPARVFGTEYVGENTFITINQSHYADMSVEEWRELAEVLEMVENEDWPETNLLD